MSVKREQHLEKKRAYYWANREKELARTRAYQLAHKDELKAKKALYLIANREADLERKKQYGKSHAEQLNAARKKYDKENREKIRQQRRSYWAKHREARNAHTRTRYATDSQFKLSIRLRNSLKDALKNHTKTGLDNKKNSVMLLLGCSLAELKTHIETQWLLNMTWDNWTTDGWHIDHIIPCDAFDLTDPIQQQQCFHYTNLQPLWWLDNLKKSNKID